MADYDKMIGLKTAVLLACSAEMGALIGGASEADCEALYNYGYELGMAFQVADDYLDAYGDQKVFGKPIGGDILNCKKSWLTVKALENGATDIIEALNAPAETEKEKAAKIERVMKIYESANVAAEAKKTIAELSSRAIFKGIGATTDPEGQEVLKRFADSLVGRTV